MFFYYVRLEIPSQSKQTHPIQFDYSFQMDQFTFQCLFVYLEVPNFVLKIRSFL